MTKPGPRPLTKREMAAIKVCLWEMRGQTIPEIIRITRARWAAAPPSRQVVLS